MFLDHTRRRSTVGRTPLDAWSARRRDLYLTTHDTHNRQISMPPVGFEPTISAGEQPQANHSSRGVLPTVLRRRLWSRNIKNRHYIYIYDISSLRVNQLLYCVSLKIYNKFANYFCEKTQKYVRTKCLHLCTQYVWVTLCSVLLLTVFIIPELKYRPLSAVLRRLINIHAKNPQLPYKYKEMVSSKLGNRDLKQPPPNNAWLRLPQTPWRGAPNGSGEHPKTYRIKSADVRSLWIGSVLLPQGSILDTCWW